MPNYKPFKKQTLAEQVATHIEESIIRGEVEGGETLPTEPEMAEQFGVSRAVVRDATRMLAAKGLIEVKHGKGSFVTHTQTPAFGDALLLALRRMGASNWDVAQFEQAMYPEVLALATQNATEDDIAHIQTTAHKYLTLHAETTRRGVPLADAPEQTSLRDSWENLLQAIFDATHNQVMTLLARPLIQLHGARDWVGLEEDLTTQETQFVKTLLALIAAGDPAAAREQTRSLMKLPSEAVDALSKTAVATPTMIVLD